VQVRAVKILTWTNTGKGGTRTHAMVGAETTWCGRFVPHSAIKHEYVVDTILPFDCQSCERAWLARPRKGTK